MDNRRKLSLFLAFLIVILCGVALFGFRQGHCPHYYRRLSRSILMQSYKPGPDVEFTWRVTGSGNTTDNADVDSSQYLSTDCVEVSVSHYRFPSDRNAIEHAEAEAKSLGKILSKGEPSFDGEAAKGERVVLADGSSRYEILRRE